MTIKGIYLILVISSYILFSLLICNSNSQQPQKPSVAGQTSSTECTQSSGDCKEDGSSNYMSRELVYDKDTGKFNGHITTNQCSNNNRWGDINGKHFGNHSAECIRQEIPSPTYTNGPNAAPLRGALGYSLSGGVNIYGPYEAGFYLGQACTNNKGSCAPGLDVAICGAHLTYLCGADNVGNLLMDSCGGHASPYHYHLDLACDYDHTASGHSQLIGVSLDGYGIYGLYESTGKTPTDLDICGGHYGPVPARTIDGVTYPAATNVYHYHTSLASPYTLGCYGPVTTIDKCKSLYSSTCNTGFESVSLSSTCSIAYDTDCPCYNKGSVTELSYDQCSVVKTFLMDNENKEYILENSSAELLITVPQQSGESKVTRVEVTSSDIESNTGDSNTSSSFLKLAKILIILFTAVLF